MSKKFSNILLGTLLLLCLVVLVLFYIQNSTGMFALSNMAAVLASSSSMLDVMMLWAYILVGLTILLLVVLAIYGMIQNPTSIKKTGLVLGLAIVLVVVSYFLASGDPVQVNLATPPTVQTLKMTDTFLLMTYILFAVSIIVLIWGSVRKLIQKS